MGVVAAARRASTPRLRRDRRTSTARCSILDEVMTGFRVSPRRLVRARAGRRRPVHLRQGDGRRAAGGGVRRPGRGHGAGWPRPARSTRPARCPGTRSPCAAGLATLRACTDEVYARLDATAAHGRPAGRRGADRGGRAAPGADAPATCSRSSSPTTTVARLRRARRRQRRRRYPAVLPRDAGRAASTCRRRAFEAWFVSAAHDDAALDRIADGAARRGPRRGGRRRGRGRA